MQESMKEAMKDNMQVTMGEGMQENTQEIMKKSMQITIAEDMRETMQAVVLNAPMIYQLKTVKKPTCSKQGLVLKTLACGLCGSDLRILRNGHRNIRDHWIIGHEIAGEVIETGEKYSGLWKKGDRLAVAPTVYCGSCDFCVAGRFELCENIKEIAQHWQGGFAEYIAIPEEALNLGAVQKIPDGLSSSVAAIAEPVSSCINAQEKLSVGLGDTVVIIGSGPIGCIHTSLARIRGAHRIIVADVSEERLKLCESFTPDFMVNASKIDLVEEVMCLTGSKGADVIITANSVPATQVQAVEMARKGGRIALFGGLPREDSKPGIDTNLIHYRGLQLIGTSTFAPRHHLLALSMFSSGKLKGESLVTHTLPLVKFKEGVKLATEGKALKVVFIPES
jgi:L-iditol 2-dehydrogenase